MDPGADLATDHHAAEVGRLAGVGRVAGVGGLAGVGRLVVEEVEVCGPNDTHVILWLALVSWPC